MRHKILTNVGSSAIVILLLATSMTGIAFLQQDTLNENNNLGLNNTYYKQNNNEKLKLGVLKKAPAIGFDNVLSDWVYLKFIQYFGDNEARPITGYSLLPKYFEIIVDRDPYFTQAISLMEVATSLFAGVPEISTQLIEQALDQIPKKFNTELPPYYLWRAKGNNEMLFMDNIPDTIDSYQQSLVWATPWNDEESRRIIEINRNSIEYLKVNPTSKRIRIGAWTNILANSADSKTVNRLIDKINSLGANVVRIKGGGYRIIVPDEIQ